jgi:LysR family transcriptional regulator, hca operon transcriptional activator
MELRHLRYFVAVADAGSLTVAAEQKLHTAPSIIGQAFEHGLQQRSDVELNLGAYVGMVARKPRTTTSG